MKLSRAQRVWATRIVLVLAIAMIPLVLTADYSGAGALGMCIAVWTGWECAS